ncbi:hypothetical protein BC835DRAFT_1547500 [Cytidiella melzeri]|nr:hypothetical protein BC835DRAFT_1547500 [Cytidiella melzeri]
MGTKDVLPATPVKAHTSSNANLQSTQQLSGNTPVTRKLAPQYTGSDWTVHKSRTAVKDDLGPYIPELPYEFFKDNILPPLHRKANVKGTITRLKKAGVITNAGNSSRWTAFPEDPHKQSDENKVFAKLASVVNAIFDNSGCPKKQERIVAYESLPDSIPLCCVDEKLGRPDGYLLFKNRFLADREDGRRYWRDIATPAEFKLQDTRDTLQDDVNKICWNMYQVMQEDARRRFVFAFTIENTQMRVWMANRSDVLVSQPFNFIEDHEKFVHFFLSQAYAEEHELGLDPTMTMVSAEPNKVPMYDIVVRVVSKINGREKIENQTYRTQKLINDDGAKALRGRGTRVWKVHRVVRNVVDFRKPGVLKDAWVDEDREREGDILEAIRDQKGLTEVAGNILKALFLTPIARGDVFIGNTRDGTRTLITRGVAVPDDSTKFPLRVPDSHQPSHAKSTVLDAIAHGDPSPSDAMIQAQRLVKYFSKFHHRIVFAEECKPLSKVESLCTVFSTLFDVTLGLMIMHQNGPGWVHRDISAGNILLDMNGNETKLSDLEYAKKLDVKTAHEIRTGTANFMAVEVDQQVYIYAYESRKPKVGPKSIDRYAAAFFRREKGNLAATGDSLSAPGPSQPPKSEKLFQYNPTHDLESLWWVAAYFVVNKETFLASPRSSSDTPVTPANSHSRLTEKQRTYARSLFYGSLPRVIAMSSTEDTPIDEHMRSLPSYLSRVCEALIELRKTLRAHYGTIEHPAFEIDKNVCNELYETFMDTFSALAEDLKDADIIVKPIPRDRNQEGLRVDTARASTTAATKRSTKRQFEDEVDTSTGSKRRKANAEVDPPAEAVAEASGSVPKPKKGKGSERKKKGTSQEAKVATEAAGSRVTRSRSSSRKF